MASPNTVTNRRANFLADRLIQGADQLAAFAAELTDYEWKQSVAGDGRSIGVVVHHVANVYPLEIQLVQTLAAGKRIEGVTKAGIDQMNAEHAREFASISKEAALEHLRTNAEAAAEAVRKLTDAELDSAAMVSLYADAPLTAQFMLEDHALRHSYHHLARIRATLGRQTRVGDKSRLAGSY